MKIIDDLIAEWSTITAAPRSIAILAVIIAGCVWLVIHWFYAAVLAGKDGQIALLRDRISAYEQQLKGQSPEQVANELKFFRDQLVEYGKRFETVTKEQTEVRAFLAKLPPPKLSPPAAVTDLRVTLNHTVSVSTSPSAGGTIGGGGTSAHGSPRTVTATAKTGYRFVNWTVNGTVISTSASYTFTLNADVTLVANFVPI
jgi:Divergent InlB B-repeat domain